MDELRNTPQKTDQFSHIFDQRTVRTNPFGENRSAERAYQRAERLSVALHLLTNHIPSSEPVRIAVRENALLLVENTLSIRDELRAPESSKLASLRSLIRHLISLNRVLMASGFISGQNAIVIIEALDELGNLLISYQRSAFSENISLSREDLIDIGSAIGRVGQGKYVKDIKDKILLKDTIAQKDSTDVAFTNGRSETNLRREQVIGTLRTGGELGIRQIASYLPEYGEKTIQRELVRLIAEGKVKKLGLKRWSRYSLVS